MLRSRVIPSLLLSSGGLVKGRNFKKHLYVGDPINAVRIFNEKEVDELVLLDISATDQRKEPDYELLERIASQAFMPLAYGGGITNLAQIEKLFRLGFEKIIINTATVSGGLSLLRDAKNSFGCQSIVASIDVKRNLRGRYLVYTHGGTRKTGLEVVEHAKRMQDAGAGEILLCSIEREGTGSGYDLSLIRSVTATLDVPLVAAGGASSIAHFQQALDAGASAVAVGDMFTFRGKHKAVLISYPDYALLETSLHAKRSSSLT